MALIDHTAILLGHSLDVARLNKKKTRSDFYAQVALPPSAINDVAALVGEVYPGVPLTTIEVNCKPNAQQTTPFVGVPSDWYILRLASQFAPELYAADGTTAVPNANARSAFYSGMRVRVHSGAWAWKNEFGKSGASFNLFGMMDAGQGGERLAIGGGGSAAVFAAHGNPNAQPLTGTAVHTETVTPAQAGSPFNQAGGNVQRNVAAGVPAAGANPFAQGQAANTSTNPFGTAA